MKKITIALLGIYYIINFLAPPKPLYAQSPGRVWQAGRLPSSMPAKFTNADILLDTVTNITYKWNNGWYATTWQLKGADGRDGAQGPQGEPGSTTVNQIGMVRFVSTQADVLSALQGVSNGTVSAIHSMNNIDFTMPLDFKLVGTRSGKVCVYLNGTTWRYIGVPTMYFIHRKFATVAEATNGPIDKCLIFRDGRVDGGSKVEFIFSIDATYGSLFEGVDVFNGGNGYDLHFCLMAEISNAKLGGIDSVGVNFDRMRVADNNGTNSQSNVSKASMVRINHLDDAYAGFTFRNSSGITGDHLISEGRVPWYHIYFDSEGSGVVKDFGLNVIHLESYQKNSVRSKEVAGIYLRGNNMLTTTNRVFSQYAHTLFEFAGAGYNHHYVNNLCHLLSGHQFKNGAGGSNSIVQFYETPNLNLFETTRWVGGAVPTYGFQEYFGQGKLTIKRPQ